MILPLVVLIPAICYSLVILFLKRGLITLNKPAKPAGYSFSVVIAARNEEKNIQLCIDSVLAQTIDKERFEIIVIDDRSIDNTPLILTKIAQTHHNLRWIRVEKTPNKVSPKKYAVTKGIEQAKNEIVVFTDADCVVPETWLHTLDCYFAEDTGLVQGITCYKEDESINRHFYGVQSIDFLSHGIVAAAGIGAGIPINSNANNFAFKKEVFSSLCGYGEDIQCVVSGDDDLLLQRIWKSGKWKVEFMSDPAGAVETNPTPTIAEAFEQRKRWGSKTVHYCLPQVLILSTVFLFYLFIAAFFVTGFIDHTFWGVTVGLVGVKVTGEALLLYPGTKIFRKKELRRYILAASVIQLPVVIAAVFSGVFGKFSWKDQKFRRKVG
ncbi:glycosyltransferase [Chitinispirillales bacterium ANBcel5]|uniref:glycosyltransferase n=1 Tax=Cellulosispirillum alkaliphilum TaxID=3039283 RepID=UPI002A584DF2|nr:glycosyltransferase [Chitinispirillales bacterium ANBcel5]